MYGVWTVVDVLGRNHPQSAVQCLVAVLCQAHHALWWQLLVKTIVGSIASATQNGKRVLVLEGFVESHSLLIPTPGSLVFGALVMQGCFVVYLAVAGRGGPRQAGAASSCRRHTRSRNLLLVSTAVCRRSRRRRFSVRRCESSSRSSLDRDPTVARAIAAARAACNRRPARQPRGRPRQR